MRTRLISAAVLVPAVAVVFWLGHPFILFGVLLLTALAAYEVANLVRAAGLPANTVIAVITGPIAVVGVGVAGLPTGLQFYDTTWIFIPPAVAIWLIATGALSLVFTDPQTGFRAWAGNLVATLYPTLLGFLAFIAVLGFEEQPADSLREMFGSGRLWLVILVLTVWTLDSAAYVVGKYFPRGRFFNRISPKKTWSGAVGGSVAAVVVCAALAAALLSVNVFLGAVTGLLIAVAAQAGDLVESMLKRAAGVKDSGTLIPGHGGILDRVDSFLFAAPILYTWLLVLMRSGLIAV
jgi:phosphatidate cytidylyltransferase